MSAAPTTPGDHLEEQRRRPTLYTQEDYALVALSAASALALVWLVFYRLTLFSGAPAFWLCTAATFCGIYALVLTRAEDRVAAVDKVMTAVVSVAALGLLVPLVLIIGYVLFRGVPHLAPRIFTQTLQFTGPADVGTGGLLHAIVGTLVQGALAVVVSVPLGIMTAVFLNEVGGPLRRPVRLFVDAMSGVPSIVAGLFIYAVLVLEPVGLGFSGLAAALALSVLMLPTVTRTAEEVLRLVPGGLREASLALGAPQWRTVWSVVLPTARAGLVTAVILGVARAVGETAPLIMTAFGGSALQLSPLGEPQSSLPLEIYRLLQGKAGTQVPLAWTGALVLIVIVLFLFTTARIVASRRGNRSARKASS